MQLRANGLKVAYKQSSIYLPPQAFSSSQDSRVVTVVYLTLNDVLPLTKETEGKDDQTFSANTTIVSSTIVPRPPDELSKPVKVVLQNRKVFFFFNFLRMKLRFRELLCMMLIIQLNFISISREVSLLLVRHKVSASSGDQERLRCGKPAAVRWSQPSPMSL